jgi:hypothetical protein
MGSAVTKQIPRAQWQVYFDGLTRGHLTGKGAPAASLEIVSPDIGDQFEAREARLLGLVYDPRSDALEVVLEGMDHLAFQPSEIWVIEEDDGFVTTLELVRDDGTRELLYLHRELPGGRATAPAPPGG